MYFFSSVFVAPCSHQYKRDSIAILTPNYRPVKKSWANFTSNVEFQQKLAELYDTPDDVDLYLGEVLDETLFPGTIIPTAQLITSLISLSGLGAIDRFMVWWQFNLKMTR